MIPLPSPIDTVRCDVLVVGAGPAGLAAATELRRRGVAPVLIVDRAKKAGGIPRECLHSPFGMREFGRVLSGPTYADRLAAKAQDSGAEIWLGASVVDIARGDDIAVTVARDSGAAQIVARCVVLATGARETSRAARLVSGERPLGVMTTGALQGFAANGAAPFRRPVIIGTELVALSALLSCRQVGAQPLAMLEANAHPSVRAPFMLLPRLLGVPVHFSTRIVDIIGGNRVRAVRIATPAGEQEIACDGVLFTGAFRPNAELGRAAGLALDSGTGGPMIDQFGRTSDPRIFACGNLLRGIETAGWCWAEGKAIARCVAADLAGTLPEATGALPVITGPGIDYALPQLVIPGGGGLGKMQLRVSGPVCGRLSVGGEAGNRKRAFFPLRRIVAPLRAGPGIAATVRVDIES